MRWFLFFWKIATILMARCHRGRPQRFTQLGLHNVAQRTKPNHILAPFWHHFGTIGHRGNHGQHGGSRPHQLGQHHSVLSVAWRSFLLLPGAILWNVLGEFLYEVYASYAYDNYVHSLCTIVTIYSTYMNMIEWYWMCISIAFMIIFFVIQGIETAGWWAKILPNQRMILVRMWRKPLDKRSCNLEQPWLVSSDHGIRTRAPWASTDAFDARKKQEFCSEESELPH